MSGLRKANRAMSPHRTRTTISRLSVAALAALCLALPGGEALLAQQHPNLERGFAPEKLYQLGDIDSVNVLNGNVTVAIPIGMAYSGGGGLTYALTLTYNSKVWDIEERAGFTPTEPYVQALPNRRANAGMGWQLSMGRLVPPLDPTNNAVPVAWVYVGPDGAEHVLHGSPTGFSKDGSFLRLRQLANNEHELDFPDGTIHKFDAQNRLIEIRDRFSSPNKITIGYTTSAWQISDRFGRTHTVRFVSKLQDGVSVQFVDRVELLGFGGLSQQVYQFTYGDRTFPRANGGVDGSCYDTDPITSQSLTAPFLEQLTLPDGSRYQLGYYLTEAGTACRVGALASLRLPTLGTTEWEYAGRRLPKEGCEPQIINHWAAKSPGVVKRRQRDAAGVLLGEWSYGFSLSATPLPASGDTTCGQAGETLPREEARVVVTSPLGDRTTHYFSVWPNPKSSINGFHRGDYSLPFTRLQGDGAGRFLSQQTADCTSCVAQRSEYVRYEADAVCPEIAFFGECLDVNRRVASQRTTFNDDGGTSVVNDLTSYAGYGHYRLRTTTGTFPAVVGGTATEANRETYTQWTPTVTASTWILDTSAYEWVKENGAFARYTQSCYLANTPFLTRRRVHVAAGSTTSSRDLLAVYDPDVAGNLVSERHYGGDAAAQALQLGSPCSIALPAAPQYQIAHTYQNGSLATSQYSGATFKHLDRTVDVSGLVRSVRDSAGIQTDFEYDTAGRRTWEKPAAGHDGWVEYVHVNATSATALANVQVRRRGNGSGSVNVLANELYVWDALGRLHQEQTLLPSGSWSKRITLYDGMGNVASVSELHTGGAPKATAYQNYDPFGRPRLIVPPDGTAHKVDLAYLGARQTRRTVRVGTTYNATSATVTNSLATTTELYDIHGRLAQVTEPNGVHTSYRYDGADRLRRVCQGAASTTCGQQRHFTYDNRGFLTSEQHPEKGASGNGFVTYSAFDARGHAGRRIDGPFNLTFSYDFAERLTQVREGSGDFRVLKQYTYATANATGQFDRGKRKTASRFNHVMVGTTPFTVELEETYTYAGRHGRVSGRVMASYVNSTQGDTFSQGWSYTPLGALDVLTYPRCIQAGCSGAPAVSRAVGHTYNRGFLTSVPGFASTISYHPNQTVSQVAHQNGVQWNQAMDPNGIGRPLSISTAFASQNWSSGTYTYDGAGNVTKMGGAYFLYDNLSRLKTANLYADISGGGIATQQSYTYDNYANLTALTGAGAVNIPASSVTNRLTGLVTYDTAGNLTSWNNNLYDVDAFGMMWRYRPAGQGVEHIYVYTADNERLWTYSPGSPSRWTLRDLDGRVLREFANDAGTWSVHKDYIYRGSTLVAAVQTNGQTHHFHPDHLGTPRLITNGTGGKLAYHVYYPYGVELSPIAQDTERLKFTGHERDLGVSWSAADDLDYMHARFYNPQVGRFMSVDPSTKSWNPKQPQSWNGYSYTHNNPLNFIDPDGKLRVCTPPESCAPPKTWWEKAKRDIELAGMLPGPAPLAVAGRAGVTAFGSLLSRVGRLFGRATGGADDAISFSKSVPRIHMGKQGKHIPGHSNYIEGRSILRADPERLAARAGTGEPVGRISRGQPGFKERVDFGDVIGDFVEEGVAMPTTKGIITYAADGTIHIVPVRP
jgi:RHS repeat-associated protein